MFVLRANSYSIMDGHFQQLTAITFKMKLGTFRTFNMQTGMLMRYLLHIHITLPKKQDKVYTFNVWIFWYLCLMCFLLYPYHLHHILSCQPFFVKLGSNNNIMSALYRGLIVTALVSAVLIFFVSKYFPSSNLMPLLTNGQKEKSLIFSR